MDFRNGLELWVGPEPTVNRVGDAWFDQTVATGFAARIDDIDRIASLGATRMRFPLLWERCLGTDGRFDWRWSDAWLNRARECGVAPIAGLVHHGSGPRDTHLLDPAFGSKLACFARAAAERYPWIEGWTPINEPLTTARFSALYGLWFPHTTTNREFLRALLHEVQATGLAMRAIREAIPHAYLMQTDDLGFASGTPPLRAQVDFENERRWLGFDLLCGRVGPQHPLYSYLIESGLETDALASLCESPCTPDIIGVNTYITSERFLDHRLDRYPKALHGGNGHQAYADTELVRVSGPGIGGFAVRLREACERYGLPVVISEAHLGCTREEQMRWLLEAWRAAESARAQGFDVRAVTAWSAFGACDWDGLLTRAAGHYEPGLWDIRSAGGAPRETALAKLARQLGHGEAPDHPVLESPGWWHREIRWMHPVEGPSRTREICGRPILITGVHGTLGAAFARLCAERGLAYRALSRRELDIASIDSVEAAISKWQPWAIVNAAGYVRVDDAEHDERVWRENADGPRTLAQGCARRGVRLLTFSSDLVFDGSKSSAYNEFDAPQPISAYGASKARAERDVLDLCPTALVIRTAAFFGPWDRYNFVTLGLARLREGLPWRASADRTVTPAYVPDLVHASLDLLIDGEAGIVHLAHPDPVTWAELARRAAHHAGLDAQLIVPVTGAQPGEHAARPRYCALTTVRVGVMPPLDVALERYVREIAHAPLGPIDVHAQAAETALDQAANDRGGGPSAVRVSVPTSMSQNNG